MLDAAHKLPPEALVALVAGGAGALLGLTPLQAGSKVGLAQQSPAERDKGDAGLQNMFRRLLGENAAHLG